MVFSLILNESPLITCQTVAASRSKGHSISTPFPTHFFKVETSKEIDKLSPITFLSIKLLFQISLRIVFFMIFLTLDRWNIKLERVLFSTNGSPPTSLG